MKSKPTHIVVAVIVVLVAFWAGYNHGKTVTAAVATTAGSGRSTYAGGTGAGTTGGFAGARGAGARGGAAGSGAVIGTIVAMDASSISVQSMATTSGSTVILYSPSTSIMKTVTGSAADLMVGSTVVVSGTANSDGSESANSIQIRPSANGQTGQ